MALPNKTALVTGGAGALGTVIVDRLVREGANVAVSSRNYSGETNGHKGTSGKVYMVQADVTNESQVIALMENVARRFGGINILVNAVGGFLPSKPLIEVTVEEWNHMMEINLKSTFLCSREALKQMGDRKYGRIINISAMVGLHPTPGKAPYAISKAAVSLLTELLGQEQKGTGITVNAIAPSILDTTQNRQSMPNEDFARWVKPENIADIVCYLCSEEAGDITGTTIRAVGGV